MRESRELRTPGKAAVKKGRIQFAGVRRFRALERIAFAPGLLFDARIEVTLDRTVLPCHPGVWEQDNGMCVSTASFTSDGNGIVVVPCRI